MGTNHRSNRRAGIIGLLLTGGMLTIVAGCSTDDIADKVAEQAAESGSGENMDVDVDSETGEFKVETEDGTFESSTGTSELPDGWPSEVPLPSDHTVTGSTSFDTDDGKSFNLAGDVPDGDEAFAEVTAAFAEGGWTELQKSTGNHSEGTSSSSTYENPSLQVVFSAMSLDDGTNTISYTVIPAPKE